MTGPRPASTRRLALTAPVVLEVGRAAYGLVGLAAPQRLATFELGRTPGRGTVTVARVLGARHLGQALAVLATGRPDAHRLGGAVDALHAASMVPWAAAARGERRYYLTSAAVAAALALLEWRAASRPSTSA